MADGRTIFISGWAHAAEVMRPLAAALGAESALCLSLPDLEGRAAILAGDGTPGGSPGESGRDARPPAAPGETPALPWRRAGCPPSCWDGLSPYAAALAARLRNLQEPVALVGWSTGGMIALETALALPEKVSRLLLVSASARFCATDGYACGLPAGNLRALAAGVARMPEVAMKGFFELAAAPALPTPDEAAAKVAAALAQGSDTLKHGLGYLRDCDLRQKLETRNTQIGTICTLVHGREDRVIPCGASEFLAAAIPGARLVLVDGAGHDLPLRSPQQVAAAAGRV